MFDVVVLLACCGGFFGFFLLDLMSSYPPQNAKAYRLASLSEYANEVFFCMSQFQ